MLTHFDPMLHFYTPWKRQKTIGFLTFSGGIEMWHWTKIHIHKLICSANQLTSSYMSERDIDS